MQKTDIILLIPLAWGTFRGFYRGLISEITSLVGMVIAVYFSARYYNAVADLINAHIQSKMSQFYISIISFIILFVLLLLLVHFISKRIEKLIETLHISFINHLAGALFGLLKWAFLVSFIIYLFHNFTERSGFNPIKIEHTWVYNILASIAPMVLPYK